jgi:glycosyltransferase involved in cell wall biosynthesis
MLQQKTDERLDLLIVGEGNWSERLESLACDLGVEDHVVFAGRKTGAELQRLIQQCEVAVVPSEWEEPMGGVALELLAAGKPLIVSKHGGLAECVGDAALLFNNGDHAMLAERMTELLGNDQLEAQLREKARAQLKKFDPEKLVGAYIDLFESVVSKRKYPASVEKSAQRSGHEAAPTR